jgi:hypothetical protein
MKMLFIFLVARKRAKNVGTTVIAVSVWNVMAAVVINLVNWVNHAVQSTSVPIHITVVVLVVTVLLFA